MAAICGRPRASSGAGLGALSGAQGEGVLSSGGDLGGAQRGAQGEGGYPAGRGGIARGTQEGAQGKGVLSNGGGLGHSERGSGGGGAQRGPWGRGIPSEGGIAGGTGGGCTWEGGDATEPSVVGAFKLQLGRRACWGGGLGVVFRVGLRGAGGLRGRAWREAQKTVLGAHQGTHVGSLEG